MTQSTFGQISEYQPDVEPYNTYEQRVRVFLRANKIDDDVAVDVFLSIIGAANFFLLASLVSPDKPTDRSLGDLLAMLRNHFSQKRVTIAERFRFHDRSQKEEESVAVFAAELRRLAAYCKFGHHLNQALRDRFVCGLKNVRIQKKLLIVDDEELTFAAAVEMATTAETVEEGLNNLSVSGRPDIRKVLPKKISICYRCGKDGHWANDCKHRVTVCRRCGKRGHLQAVCRSSKLFQKSSTVPVKNIMNQGVGEEKDDGSSDEDLSIFQVNSASDSPPPILVTAQLNGCPISMEVDTGAAVSIVSKRVY
uniref:CCHC-type domain-containing protein n=1 Tax=Amphimedon queenslandica TaxID=400682 RepID=A0A1X7VMV4_AMPQE